MMPPSITKYGSPVRLDAQIVALRPRCARTALKASPKKKTHDWGRLGLLISLVSPWGSRFGPPWPSLGHLGCVSMGQQAAIG